MFASYLCHCHSLPSSLFLIFLIILYPILYLAFPLPPSLIPFLSLRVPSSTVDDGVPMNRPALAMHEPTSSANGCGHPIQPMGVIEREPLPRPKQGGRRRLGPGKGRADPSGPKRTRAGRDDCRGSSGGSIPRRIGRLHARAVRPGGGRGAAARGSAMCALRARVAAKAQGQGGCHGSRDCKRGPG